MLRGARQHGSRKSMESFLLSCLSASPAYESNSFSWKGSAGKWTKRHLSHRHGHKESSSFSLPPTMVDNSQEYRLKYWATRSSVRSFARTAHSVACFALLAALTRSLARSLRSLPRSWESEFLMSHNVLVLSHSAKASLNQGIMISSWLKQSFKAWSRLHQKHYVQKFTCSLRLKQTSKYRVSHD